MKKLMTLLIALVFSSITWGQTILISPTGNGGLETGNTLALNNWTVVNGTYNTLTVGTLPTVYAGTNCAYSWDGTAWAGTANASVNHFYSDITFPAGETVITLSFYYKLSVADATYDYLKVFLVPTTTTPVAGTQLSSGQIGLSGGYDVATTWTLVTITVPSSAAGTTQRLVFSWRGDGASPNSAVAIDNISLTSRALIAGDAAPTTYTATAVSATGITIGWTDNSTNETAFRVYRSTDNITFTKVGTDITSTTTAGIGTTYSQVQTSLLPGTTYYYRIVSVFEAESGYLTGNQTTNVAGAITSIATGNWSDITTWSTGTIPTAGDNVTIADGHTVYIDTAVATCLDLTVGQGASGILTFTCATASTLTVNGSIAVALGGDFNAGTTATIVHNIYIGGNSATTSYASNLTVDGSFDMWATATTGRATITFFGVQNSVISGTGSNLDFNNTNILNKGAITATSTVTPPVLDLQRAFTVQGANTLGFIATHTAGTLKISGTFTQSNPIYTTNAYTIPANGGIWLNNANYTVSGLGASPTNNGLFRVTAGTYNIGTGSGNSLAGGNGSVYIIEGGAINVTGRFNIAGTGVYYNQSGGTVSVATIGNASVANPSFGITSATGTSFIMSGGTIILFQRNSGTLGATMKDYYVVASPTITGGTLQVGTAATTTNFNFRMNGYAPTTIIDNTTNNKSIEVYQTSGNFVIIGNLTVNTGTTFDCLGMNASVAGDVVNNGIIQGLVAGSRFDFAGIAPQTYSGTGTFGTLAAPFIGTGVGIANTSSVILNSPIVTTRVNLFVGTFINSAQITLGNGGASSGYIQRGGSALYPAGAFDVAPTFNVGTGGMTINYYTASTATTSGAEIPASRAITNLTINNVNGAILSGGALTLGNTGILTLTLGNLTTTSTNLLTLANTTSTAISGGSATSYVNGPLQRTFAANMTATGTYTTASLFPIGFQTNYQPLYIDPTTNAGGSIVFKGEAFNTNTGTMGAGVTTLSTNRWEATITSGSTNLTSTFMRIGDAAILSSNQILQANAAAGIYGAIPAASTYAAGTPNTLTTTGSQIQASSYFGYFAYGDLTPCTAPFDQPTAFVASNITSSSFTGSYTAAVSAPSHYLVVRYASGATPANPVDFTNYIAGGTLGTGTIVAVTTSNTFNSTGLSAGTTYDYYIYSFNNNGCYGPVYNTVSPLLASVTTCVTINAPGTPTATNILTGSFTASWTASSTPAVDYYLDVATDNAFTSLVSGYANKNEGTSLTDNITGLTSNTTYYVRVRALSGTCPSSYSGTLIVKTLCDAVSVFPYTESFGATLGCWSASEAVAGASYHWETALADASHGVAAPQSGAYFAKLNVYNASSSNNPYYLNSLSFTLNATPKQVKYYYWLGSTGYTLTPVPLALEVSTDGGSTWTNLYSHTSGNSTFTATSSVTGWTQNIIDLTAYAGLTIQFRFASNSNFGNGYCNQGIDEFTIEDIPSCIEPTALNVTSLTATSATINWTASLSIPTGGYEYEVRTSGAAGSGATGLTTAGSTAAGVVTADISGLTANTNYSFYVRSNCGSGLFSAWTSAGTFFTGYCVPSGSTSYYLTNFTTTGGLTNIDNTTTASVGGYGDYSSTLSCSQYAGLPIDFSLTPSSGTNYFYIWIDWNNDLDFLDGGETIVATTTYTSSYSVSYTVPAGTPAGSYRMRVANSWSGAITSCGPASSGEYEDYSFVIDIPSAPTISSLGATSGCVGTSLIINGSDLAGATSVTIGGTSATITANTATEVTVTVGTGTTGTVAVTTPGGTATSIETFTVNQLPLLFTVSGGGSYCIGGSGVSVTLDGSEIGVNYDLSTSPVTTLAGTGSALTFGPSTFATGTYTIIATNALTNCSLEMTGNAIVTVNQLPTAVTATASSNQICTGTSIDLFSSANPEIATNTLSAESFENAGAIPTGWGSDLDVDGNLTNAALTYVTTSSYPTGFSAYDDTYFVRFNSYTVSAGNSARLKQTSSFSTVGYSGLTVNFAWTQDDQYPSSNDNIVVQYSTDGTTWTTAGTPITRVGAADVWTTQSVNLPVAAENQGTLYIAFLFTSAYGNDCHLDDVTVSGNIALPATFSWTSIPAGFTSSDQNPTNVIPADTTTYTVAISNSHGCSASASVTVNVNPIPVAPTVAVVDNCGNSTLTASAYTGTLSWSTIETTPSIVVTTAGTYTVNQTVDGCTSPNGSGIAAPLTVPVVNLGTDITLCGDQTTILDAGNPGASYLWTPGGQITQTITVDSLGLGIGPHTFSVLVTDPNTCSATGSVVVTFDPCTGIEANNSNIIVSVVPNPSNGMFYLNVEGINETVTLNIYAINGKVIYSEQVDNTGLINKPIDLKSYPKGMYFLRLINNNMTHTEKIIIE